MKIYVGNLSSKITDKQLHDLGLPYGQPDSANVARQVAGGASKGFGFIEYRTDAEATAAIAGLDGKVVDTQKLKVHKANALDIRPWSAAGSKR
jgi:cold-inducible RNA-binding protein